MSKDIFMYDNPLFLSLESCKEELVDQELIKDEKECLGCGGIARLCIYRQRENERLVYRCSRRTCRMKMPLFTITTRLPLHRYLFFTHLLVLNCNYNVSYQLTGVSSSTIAKAKSSLSRYYEHKNSSNMLIGGPGVEVEVDESVLCRRGIIRNPTSREDEISDTVWILGIVEKYD
jgi:hypothetical protein